MRGIKHIVLGSWLLAGLLTFSSCHNDATSNVPNCVVSLDLDIYKQYPHFVIENGFQTMTFTEPRWRGDYLGYGGILVWINVINEYCAADMTCPRCLLPKKPVEVEGFYAICPTCGEHFDLSTRAFPTKGKADQPLRNYQVSFYNGVLRVRN